MKELLQQLIEKIDNDSIIIFGLVGLALIYAFQQQGGEQVVSNIVAMFGGYIGGQYVSTKKSI